MKALPATVEIPLRVLESVDTLDELEDWLMARNPRVVKELREARKQDLAVNSNLGSRLAIQRAEP